MAISPALTTEIGLRSKAQTINHQQYRTRKTGCRYEGVDFIADILFGIVMLSSLSTGCKRQDPLGGVQIDLMLKQVLDHGFILRNGKFVARSRSGTISLTLLRQFPSPCVSD